MIASLLLLGTFVLLGLPAALVLIPWTVFTGDIGPLYRTAMWIVRAGLRAAGIRIHVEGRDAIPAGACIFMSNHVSNLDPPILFPLIPGRTSVFLKQSLMKIPVLGYGMRLAEFVPVARDGTIQGAQENVRLGRAVLAKGISLATFVEGTRSRDGHMLPFKKGPFYLAMESLTQVVPVSIAGTYAMMPKGTVRIRPGLAEVRFHAALDPADFPDREALMEAVRQSIRSGLPEWMWGE